MCLALDFADGCASRSGGVVGGQIGYRWQANQWVFGVEAQGDWADLSRTRVSLLDPALSLSTRTTTDGIGLFTGQIGYAWNAALFYVKGGAAVTSNRFTIHDDLTSALNWPRPARPAGAAPSVSDLSTASHRTGRSVLNTTTCSWAMPIIRSRASRVCRRCCQQPDHPRRGYGHLAHQLPLRRLRGANRSSLLINRLSPASRALAPAPRRGFFFKFRVLRQLGENHKEQSSPLDLDQCTGRINERPS